jgi:SAM-dependent methyltransferase
MVHYWKTHYGVRGAIDWRTDPDGLNNVCQSGAPAAVNRYYHRSQRRAYLRLLAPLLPFDRGARALDIGCGAGRWSRLLTRSGLEVTGIDLQDELVAANRSRNVDIRFEVCPVQDFRSPEPFDLLSSVTVLQHLPEQEQVKAVANMATLCRPGGHALILENVGDHSSPHVFPRSPGEWIRLFETEGFRRVDEQPYDFSPVQRLYYRVTQSRRMAHAGVASAALPRPEQLAVHPETKGEARLRRIDHMVRVAACAADATLEPALISVRAPFSTIHVGLRFERRTARG